MEDNQEKTIMRDAREMAKGGVTIVESTATTVLDNAFTSGTGSDGKVMCASDHDLINSVSTGDNALTAVLDSDGLEEALILARRITDESNQFVDVVFDTLVVPPELEVAALQLSQSQKVPENGDNANNIFRGRYNVVVNQYLSSTTAWFLVASGNSNEMKPRFYWRVKPMFRDKLDTHSDNFLFHARERFSVGHTGWQNIIGSTGTGA